MTLHYIHIQIIPPKNKTNKNKNLPVNGSVAPHHVYIPKTATTEKEN
jgi:hypothetical protein